MLSVPTQWDDTIGIRNFLLANFLDLCPAVRALGARKRGLYGLEALSGGGTRGPGPWGRGQDEPNGNPIAFPTR